MEKDEPAVAIAAQNRPARSLIRLSLWLSEGVMSHKVVAAWQIGIDGVQESKLDEGINGSVGAHCQCTHPTVRKLWNGLRFLP